MLPAKRLVGLKIVHRAQFCAGDAAFAEAPLKLVGAQRQLRNVVVHELRDPFLKG
jgi:hypothetical protein